MKIEIEIKMDGNTIAMIDGDRNPQAALTIAMAKFESIVVGVRKGDRVDVLFGDAIAQESPEGELKEKAPHRSGGAKKKKTSKEEKKTSKTRSRAKAKSETKINTSSQNGRDKLDAMIVKDLSSMEEWVRADQLGAASAASAESVRSSLHRLIERGIVKRRGNTRATEYAIAEKV